MNNERTFRLAPYHIVAWIWTVTYFIGLLFFGYRTVSAVTSGLLPALSDLAFTLLILGLLVYAWLRSVKSYDIAGDDLIIARAGSGKLRIAIGNIVGAQASPDVGGFFNPSFLSIGGVFGWAGRVRVRQPSDVKSLDADAYGTNPKYSVLLELKSGRTIIVTPADPQGLASALNALSANAPIVVKIPRAGEVREETQDGGARPDKAKPWLQGNKK